MWMSFWCSSCYTKMTSTPLRLGAREGAFWWKGGLTGAGWNTTIYSYGCNGNRSGHRRAALVADGGLDRRDPADSLPLLDGARARSCLPHLPGPVALVGDRPGRVLDLHLGFLRRDRVSSGPHAAGRGGDAGGSVVSRRAAELGAEPAAPARGRGRRDHRHWRGRRAGRTQLG